MLETKIAQIINEVMLPNIFGGDSTNSYATITEDLRNVVDVGTKIADMDANTLKDINGKFAIGVVNEFLPTIPMADVSFGLNLSSQEYAGVLQRVKSRFTKTYDTPILSLEDYNADSTSPDYNDGHYYGVPFDARLITKATSFMIPYSIPVEMFKKSFMSKEGVLSLVSLIENSVTNTLVAEVSDLARAVLRKLILSANSSRKIQLITLYNTEFGFSSGDDGFVSLTTWKNDINFKLWCQETIIRLKRALMDYNTKYNDGTVETRTDMADIRTTLLNEFATALDFANANVYNRDVTNIGEYYTTNFWQNSSHDLLPVIKSGSTHDQIKERVKDAGVGVSDDVVTVDHVVGLIYTKYSGGIREILNKTTTDYIAKGDFNQFFHHVGKEHFIDERESCISLVLA